MIMSCGRVDNAIRQRGASFQTALTTLRAGMRLRNRWNSSFIRGRHAHRTPAGDHIGPQAFQRLRPDATDAPQIVHGPEGPLLALLDDTLRHFRPDAR